MSVQNIDLMKDMLLHNALHACAVSERQTKLSTIFDDTCLTLVSAAPTEKEMDERLEYEMDEQDMEFVSKTLQQQHKLVLNEDKFEHIIDRLEKESFKLVCYARYVSIRFTVCDSVCMNRGKCAMSRCWMEHKSWQARN
jgi:hypothetical protein